MNIADKAKEIVMGDREKVHGDPGKNLRAIAALWSAYLNEPLQDTDVANMMILLKIARLKNNPSHEDSNVDLIGYAILHDIVVKDK